MRIELVRSRPAVAVDFAAPWSSLKVAIRTGWSDVRLWTTRSRTAWTAPESGAGNELLRGSSVSWLLKRVYIVTKRISKKQVWRKKYVSISHTRSEWIPTWLGKFLCLVHGTIWIGCSNIPKCGDRSTGNDVYSGDRFCGNDGFSGPKPPDHAILFTDSGITAIADKKIGDF